MQFALPVILLFFLAGALSPRSCLCATFPEYQIIRPNVSFWEDIYGKYSTREAVLHDREEINRIYAVVQLVPWGTPGSSKINSNLIKLAKIQLKDTLDKLGHGRSPSTEEEKRIAALFPKARRTSYLKAKDNIRLQLGQKNRFIEGVIRSGKYMPAIKKIFKEHGLPEALAYLPHVESSFNPTASSKAGAVGLWQFTKSTGLMYTTINEHVDERYDPWLSTHAAAELLKENYKHLQSWPLALTAYNYGRPGMVRAVASHKDYETIFSKHETGLFKFASRNFYSEFLAAVKVAKRIEADSTIILERPEATLLVPMTGFASVSDICTFFRISQEDITRLNPALLSPVVKGISYIPKGYEVRLPKNKRIRLRCMQMRQFPYHKRQHNHTIYIVKKGDTLSQIAKRNKISINVLKKLNKLDKTATIIAGQQLFLPLQSTRPTLVIGKGKTKPN
ncbi:lytic transglycosylase domain-containing protein [Desulfogranum japonicum]|uniref:lytic transglycosylase domain-containing protein n=1 Tax=Desulfogranum japonicum TaxID=231447 RepID=UPI0013788375|nr:lytic transglycosylase domain-containing protein [Desulfogranum japonicum]